MIDLDEIEARANAATPGPWRNEHPRVWGPAPDSETCSMQIAKIGYAQFDDLNAAFIASARTDVPALIAEVRRLRERLDASNAVFEQLVELLLRHLNDTPTVDDDDEP